MSMATIYGGLPFVAGNHKSQDILIAMAWCRLKVRQTSVKGENFLSSGCCHWIWSGTHPLRHSVRVLWSSFGCFSHSVVSWITGSLSWARIQWLSARFCMARQLSSSIRACMMISYSCWACSCISLGSSVSALSTVGSLV